jgi:hypothetical protein
MIRKPGDRFAGKIMLRQNASAADLKFLRSSGILAEQL